MDNNLQKYFAFVTTVDSGSFTRAAERLNYSQSSVSKMIADLEKEWNVTLLERDRNGVHLTSSGEQILPYARQLIGDYRKLEEHVHLLNGIQTGVIRVGTFASVAINWLPNIVAEFQKDFPMIECEMLLGDYSEVENWIRDGRVDCGFLSLPSGKHLKNIETDSPDSLSEGNHHSADNFGDSPLSRQMIFQFYKELELYACDDTTQENFNKLLLEKDESLVYACLSLRPKSMEELLRQSGYPMQKLADILQRLIQKDFITESFKNYYIRKI